jgi:predicted translin family RNA/ssDNA-binding protein
MNQFDKIRQEIAEIERELFELRQAAGRNQIQGSLKELSRKNDRIKNAFKTISSTISS